MFEFLTSAIEERMRYLEELDAADRENETPYDLRLRQVRPDTGRFLAILAATSPAGDVVEIGTSAGYSTMWLSLAARVRGTNVTTYEIHPKKAAMARETFAISGTARWVNFVFADATEWLNRHDAIAFCFVDANKEIYETCWDLICDRVAPGGIVVADNTISHREDVLPMMEKAMHDPRFDVVEVPIDKGELLCRRRENPSGETS